MILEACLRLLSLTGVVQTLRMPTKHPSTLKVEDAGRFQEFQDPLFRLLQDPPEDGARKRAPWPPAALG